MRLFIALELSQAALDAAAAAAQTLRGELDETAANVRWTPPEQLHLTLRFLGESDPSQVDAVSAAIAAAALERAPLALRLDGFGLFGNRQPRVIWLGLAGELDELQELAERLNAELSERGFPSERRRLGPHLTLGRVRRGATREDRAALRRAVAKSPALNLETQGQALTLIHSTLTRTGAIHRSLDRYPLPYDGQRPRGEAFPSGAHKPG